MDYHLLSDFRRDHQEAMNDLLTKIVATLMAGNLVTLKEVAQDGMRVRASAGSGPFRRKSRLEECLEAAQEQVERLVQEWDTQTQGSASGSGQRGNERPGNGWNGWNGWNERNGCNGWNGRILPPHDEAVVLRLPVAHVAVLLHAVEPGDAHAEGDVAGLGFLRFP